ncbi:late endosomal/lysosomal adaptor, MAPK and MTOR activator 5 [Lycorma delicatula]|uniref:late endosomal/lysosomal adaptor, MAPK and MTOR activator 5 n=1 Tax=Lycorma delicatula TaxID=130591 RepID=UPI003F51946B
MEKSLESCLHEIQNSDDVTGCLVADKHGLCLTAMGNAKPENTGIISAFAKQAAKLEPTADMPVILLESDNRKCLIKQTGNITGAVFKCSQLS